MLRLLLNLLSVSLQDKFYIQIHINSIAASKFELLEEHFLCYLNVHDFLVKGLFTRQDCDLFRNNAFFSCDIHVGIARQQCH